MHRGKSSVKHLGAYLALALLTSSILGILTIGIVSAAPALTLKWTAAPTSTSAATYIGAQAADLRPDIPGLEIVLTGITPPIDPGSTNGVVVALNGATGSVVWKVTPGSIQNHQPFEIVDLNRDGELEIVVSSIRRTLALNGRNGSTYWINTQAPSYDCWPTVGDVNGDGYIEVFVSSGFAPYEGVDYITALSYDGRILAQNTSWHPCWGGLGIGDANFDGKPELYQGDRGSGYNPSGDSYKYGGWGVRCLDPITLKTIWNRSDISCSSHIPMLADVDKDGILDVIVGTQSGSAIGSNGIAVLRASDGSVVTTGGKYRLAQVGISTHSQPTICDIDYDGNLELISNQNGYPMIWDLYDWKLDATLPVVCGDPPKVGDVNGDGRMDIVAVTGSEIRSYSAYVNTNDPSRRDYLVQVDVVGGLNSPNCFTLLADVDADGSNELIVTSRSGYVYCFDTPSPVSNPRSSSETAFYSGRRLGVAEYVPLPVPMAPVISEELPLNGATGVSTGLSQLSFRLKDPQGDGMNYVVTTAPNIGSGSGTNVHNGVFSVPVDGLSYATTYTWTVSATDGMNPTTKTFVFTTLDSPPLQEWWNTDWKYRKEITVSHANVVSGFTNYPLLVSLTDSNLAGHAQPDGDDVVFTDHAQQKLDHEIESYDSATGRLVAWVRVPWLSSTVDTSLYMYYGNPSCGSQESTEAVWDYNFLMVQHLSETSGVHYDSTLRSNDGSVFGSVAQGVAGKIGGSDDFNGGYVELPRTCTVESQFTFSAWLNPRPGARYILSEWTNNQGAFLQVAGDSVIQLYINGIMVQKTVTLNQWHYVVATYDGTTARLYVDGGAPASVSASSPTWPTQSMYVGDRSDHQRQFKGLVDEVRVSNIARSNEWVNTEYTNQRNPSAFYMLGPEEVPIT